MCSMRISCLIRSLDIFKFSLCMSYRCQYAFCGDILSELHSPRKFRCRIPTFDAMGFFQQRDILFRIRIFDILRNLSACHLHIEVMSFQMQTEYGPESRKPSSQHPPKEFQHSALSYGSDGLGDVTIGRWYKQAVLTTKKENDVNSNNQR